MRQGTGPACEKLFSLGLFIALALQMLSPLAFAQTTSTTLGPPETNPPIPATSTTSSTLPSGTTTTTLQPSNAPSTPLPSTTSPTPSQIGACTISELSLDDWARIKKAAFGFEGKELTDKSDAKLREQKAGQNVIVNNYNFPVEDSTTFMKVKELAQLLGRDPKGVAEELGVEDDKDDKGAVTLAAAEKEITVAQARTVAAKDPKGEGAIARLRAMVSSKKAEVQSPGFEAMKVSLPSGREVPLSEFYKLAQIRASENEPEACLLKNTAIRGRLEYSALLDEDLLLGADSSNKTLGVPEQTNPSHLNADHLSASLSNFGGNLVIPSAYERAVAGMKKFMYWDIAVSGAIMISSAFDLKAAQRSKEMHAKQIELTQSQSSLLPYFINQEKDKAGPLRSSLLESYAEMVEGIRTGKLASMPLKPELSDAFNSKVSLSMARYAAEKDPLAKAELARELAVYGRSMDPEIFKEFKLVASSDSQVAEKMIADFKEPKDLQNAIADSWAVKPPKDQFDMYTKFTYGPEELSGITGQLEAKSKQAEGLKGTLSAQQAREASLKDMIASAGSDPTKVDPLKAQLDGVVAEQVATSKQIDGLNGEISQLADQQKIIAPLSRTNGDTQLVRTFGQAEGSRAAISKIDSEEILFAEQATNYGKRRFWSNVAMGMLWLGPGRLALELAGQLTFASYGKPSDEKGDGLRIYVNNDGFAKEFRKSTDFLGIGGIVETISEFMPFSVPPKAFGVGKVILVQAPDASDVSRNSQTSISQLDSNWLLQTNWAGESSATTFEDVKDGREVTSQAIQSNNLRIGGVLQRKKELAQFYKNAIWVAPLLSWKLLEAGDPAIRPVATILQIQLLQYYVDNIVDPATFGNEKCSDETLDAYIRGYRNMVGATTVVQALYFFPGGGIIGSRFSVQALEKIGFGAKDFLNKYVRRVVSTIDPVDLYKQRAAALVFNYAMNCKDTSYKVLAYQKIPTKTTSSSVLDRIKTKTTDPLGVNQIVGKLNVGQAFAGVGAQIKKRELKDILNTKALLLNQNGVIRPEELYSIHLDPEGADLQWWGVFEKQCFRNCLTQADGKFICADATGGYASGPDGNRQYLFDREHALMSDFLPSLGMVVPNKLITAPLSCDPSSPVLEATGDSKLVASTGSCAATECALKSLEQVSGRNPGRDLSAALGPVQAIYTTQGVASLFTGEFRFIRTTGVQTTESVTTLKVPGLRGTQSTIQPDATQVQPSSLLKQQNTLAGLERRFKAVQLMGDGQVRASGSVEPLDQMGELLTIQAQNGVIHFDRASRKLYIVLKVLAEAPSRDITGIRTDIASTQGSKDQLQKLSNDLAALQAALASGQLLSKDQLELLKKILEKPTLTGAGLTDAERKLLQSAQEHQASRIPLSQAESDVLSKARQQEALPGVLVLPSKDVSRIETILKDQNVPADKTKEITDKLAAGQALTPEQKAGVQQAIKQDAQSGKVSQQDATDLAAKIEKTVLPTSRASDIVNALAQGKSLTAEQKQLAQNTASSEAAAAAKAASSASSTPTPAIKLGGVTSKVGAEESARSLNTALDKIGAVERIKTEKTDLLIDKNDKGEAVIRLADKQKGTSDELKLTGAPTKDGNGVSFPTDKGPVKVEVNVNKDSGAPVVNINGPNGLRDSSPLILASGPGGYLFFDPKTGTWRIGNGVPISADDSFGKQGATFFGGPDGTRGIAQAGQYGAQPSQLQALTASNPLLSLPSWPEDAAAAGAMLAFILLGVVFVRMRRRGG